VVAVASSAPRAGVRANRLGWSVASALVVLAGVAIRLGVGGAGIGERSAVVMSLLLIIPAWLAARLLSGPRTALLVVLVISGLLDLAALPPRNPPPYDDLQAFYRTDQVLSAHVPVPPGGASTLTLLAQPVFSGTQPQFGLGGEINGLSATWTCPFTRGVHWLALPVALSGVAQANVQLHLTGSPGRDGDYLIVYASSQQGGFLISLGPPDPSATRCSVA
jgi:hypothetical protein